ncbi:MAG: PIN domain-containing protein [Spirochaetes bacterium]|nr:PIN domain-containing protein [Spirochaetota bacterium]
MPSLDTNCLLRWLLDDVPEQTALLDSLFDSEESFAVADAALIETVFVFEKLKKISRESIKKAITAIIENDSIVCSRELFIEILPNYTKHPKLSFVDCYLEAFSRKTGNLPLLTFDQKLANQLFGAKLIVA